MALTEEHLDEVVPAFTAGGVTYDSLTLRDLIKKGQEAIGADAKFREAADIRKTAEAKLQEAESELAELRAIRDDLAGMKDMDAQAFVRTCHRLGMDTTRTNELWNLMNGITTDDSDTDTDDTPARTGPMKLTDLPPEVQEAVAFTARLKQKNLDPEQVLTLSAEQLQLNAKEKARGMIRDRIAQDPILSKRPKKGQEILTERVLMDLEGRVNAGIKLPVALDQCMAEAAELVSGVIGTGSTDAAASLIGVSGLGASPANPRTTLHPPQHPKLDQSSLRKQGGLADYFNQAYAAEMSKTDESESDLP